MVTTEGFEGVGRMLVAVGVVGIAAVAMRV